MPAANVPIKRLLTEERIVGVIDLHTTETVYHRGDDYLSVDCSRVEAWPAEACGDADDARPCARTQTGTTRPACNRGAP